MQKIELVLKNDKAKSYTTISWLIIVLNLIAFLYFGISRSATTSLYSYIAALLLVIILAWIYINNKNKKPLYNLFSLGFTIIIITWVIIPFYWAAVINFFLYIIQDIATRKLVVLFFDDFITYPSYPKQTIQWKQLNNVILKDGLLTIDCKDNKVFQNEIVSEVNEIEFNEFCKQQLKSAVSI